MASVNEINVAVTTSQNEASASNDGGREYPGKPQFGCGTDLAGQDSEQPKKNVELCTREVTLANQTYMALSVFDDS